MIARTPESRCWHPARCIENNVLENVLFGIYLKSAADSVIRGNTIGGKDLAVQRRGDGIRIWQSHRTLIEGQLRARKPRRGHVVLR